ncbi:MAG: MotA/TolQ/ExbB proton channel family protein [Bacteroidetes bacterium]|nr:MAG: MotA/TolQ/ExbB proton channel family protein [Bacteroidota bacterium]
MRKLFALLTMMALLSFGPINQTFAQDNAAGEEQVAEATNEEGTEVIEGDTTIVEDTVVTEEAVLTDEGVADDEAAVEPDETFHQVLKRYFIEGSAGFMSTVLLALILGLALVIERIIYLNLATTNTRKLLEDIESSLKGGGLDAAKDVCRDTSGPVASIFYQGLMKYDEGLESVEKSIIAYGSVQMGKLEKGLSWISLFIALAPMLGFMGTVIGMIQAFDMIEKAGDINPTVVASGIKVALLTTVFGLIVAIILQVFYNYLISKVDSLVNDMEDSSISFMDLLAENKK